VLNEKSKLIELKQTMLLIRIYNFNQGTGFKNVCIIRLAAQIIEKQQLILQGRGNWK
jgi:hypothetical protein